MMTGMAYEIGARWHRDDEVTVARDSTHYRAAMASREAQRSATKRASHPGKLGRLITTLHAPTSARPAAR